MFVDWITGACQFSRFVHFYSQLEGSADKCYIDPMVEAADNGLLVVRSTVDIAGLGTVFFPVQNVPVFPALLKNVPFFPVLFLSFWRLMRPKRT